MFTFDFKTKLKRLNDKLFVSEDKATKLRGESVSSLMYRVKKHSQAMDYNYLEGSKAREYWMAHDQGHTDQFICAVPSFEIPEHDVFDAEGKLSLRGWRSTVLTLVDKKLVSLARARSVFACQGLGVEEYDNIPRETKARWARGERWKKESKLYVF